jgi:hypothetical protein
VFGAALKAIWGVLGMIPAKVWASLAVFLAVLGLVWYVHHDGYAEGVAKGDAKVKKLQAAWDAERAQLYAAVEAEKARQAEVVTKTVVQYRDRVQVVMKSGRKSSMRFKSCMTALFCLALTACSTTPPQVISLPLIPDLLLQPPSPLKPLPSYRPSPEITKPAAPNTKSS